MSRARDNANLGAQAGSGLDASDITTGVLPVGVTGGSGLNAVSPANLASGALPVGVTGGSGLTSLGTVTEGNLSNSAIVYPAGHVIQTVKNSYNSGDSLVTVLSTLKKVKSGTASYYWTGTITPSGASNDVLIKMSFSLNVHKTSDTYAGGRVGINKDAQTPSSDTSGTDIFSTKDHGIYFHNNHASATFNIWMPIYIEFLDVAPGASRLDYYLTYSSYGSSNVTINSSSAYQPFQCILQEIQR